MLKKILCILIVSLNFNLNAEELNIRVLETKLIDYPNGMLGSTKFTILCVNGYKWLQSGVGNTQSTSQMFENNIVYAGGMKMYNVSAIKCPN